MPLALFRFVQRARVNERSAELRHLARGSSPFWSRSRQPLDSNLILHQSTPMENNRRVFGIRQTATYAQWFQEESGEPGLS